MSRSKEIFRDLQKHLDKHPIGFPSMRSGADIRILKHYFTPQEAKIVLKIDYKYEPVKVVYERLPDIGLSFEDFLKIIMEIVEKGGIMIVERNGKKLIKTLPFVVGMFEHKLYQITPEYVRDYREFISDKSFGLSFISSEPLQMRTIPIEKSIEPQKLSIASYDNVKNLIEETTDPIVVNECICRQVKEVEGHKCQLSKSIERCIALREMAKLCIIEGLGRVINKDEALEIIKQSEKEGLVLQPSNAQDPEFICCCCKCCCGILDAHRNMPRPAKFWATNYYSEMDIEICSGCGICATKCPASAITQEKAKTPPEIDLNMCIGCGVCVVKCPNKAMRLVEKNSEIVPPKTDDDLYEIIMQNKKGKFGSLMRIIKKVSK